MVDQTKLSFLKSNFPQLLRKLKGDEKPQWGVLNPQQMIEHFGESVMLASGRVQIPLMADKEKLPALKAFVMSDKEFKPGTKNPIMKDVPAPVKFDSIETAIQKLEKAISIFDETWKIKSESDYILNPFFGELNFEEQVQLLHKHARHHLKQFGLIE
ncbi:MAG TPA: hypothetical protein PKN75_03905 [Bacteroidia bacterium]|nr:hypothetical protein [Bacteroidia bacterium]HNU32714.1 hypothetical protein [Bacteroidia bacterium]